MTHAIRPQGGLFCGDPKLADMQFEDIPDRRLVTCEACVHELQDYGQAYINEHGYNVTSLIQTQVGNWIDSVLPIDPIVSRKALCVQKFIEEAHEFTSTPTSEEAADVVITLLSHAFFGEYDLMKAVERKLAVNKQRFWKTNEDGTISHV